MKCKICKKNEATENYWYNINGQKSELHLCPECASKMSDKIPNIQKSIYDTMNFDNLASAFFNMTSPMGGLHEPEILKAVSKCPTCGMTYEMFASNGKLGCSDCYNAFHDRMLRPLKQIHGTYEHIGKIPTRAGGSLKKSKKLASLKLKLDKAIQKQEFEQAAAIRDEIKKIEGEA